MKNRTANIVVITALLVGALVAFALPRWRGLRPVVLPPPADIAEEIRNAQSAEPGRPHPDDGRGDGDPSPKIVNTTGMPLTLPPGFSISVFAEGLGKPRDLEIAPDGVLLVSIPEQGRVIGLPDADNDGRADRVVTVVDGLSRPHGIAVQHGGITIAENDAVVSYDYLGMDRGVANRKKLADLPSGGGHGTRSLLLDINEIDSKLLVSVGSSCNVCNEDDKRRAAVHRVTKEGLEPFATGLRNAVFMAVHPVTGDIWTTEMGRDLLGDDTPPDEVNIVRKGGNYGWPTCYGKNVVDHAFHPDDHVHVRPDCMVPFGQPSHIDLPAHVAPLGLAFIAPAHHWPSEWDYDLLIAEHGSWNSTTPVGYQVVRVDLDERGERVGDITPFITGWLTKDGRALGRPVDLRLAGDVLYISDDKAGVVYRVGYEKP